MGDTSSALQELGDQLAGLGWVTDLFVAGSLATGDYVARVSDLDLMALVDGPVGPDRWAALTAVHQSIDEGVGRGLNVGCAYVPAARLADLMVRHPTWTHGSMAQRRLSGVVRAELVHHGFAVFGRRPQEVLPTMSRDDVRQAARAELVGYWDWAARRPWLWLDPAIAELGLTSMARGRHTMATGELLTKSRAIEHVHAPAWLQDQLRARRRGEEVTTPRLRTAVIAWRDTRRTVALARSLGRS